MDFDSDSESSSQEHTLKEIGEAFAELAAASEAQVNARQTERKAREKDRAARGRQQRAIN